MPNALQDHVKTAGDDLFTIYRAMLKYPAIVQARDAYSTSPDGYVDVFQ